MDGPRLLIAAMAEKCKAIISQSARTPCDLPEVLRRPHLLWMCNCIERDAEAWTIDKLQRWLGFIQAGMIANRMLDLNQVKAMFDEAKNAYAEVADDQDWVEHLDPSSSFEVDIGGQG